MIDELVDRLARGDELSEQEYCTLLLHPLPLHQRTLILTSMAVRAYLEQGRPPPRAVLLILRTSNDVAQPVHVTIHDDAGHAHVNAYFPR